MTTKSGRHPDVEAVLRASQVISDETSVPALIEKLLRIAVEHAGAERGLLILLRDGEPRIEAEAIAGPGKVEVVVRRALVTSADLLQSALRHAMRTRELVHLDDASADRLYSKDQYVRRKRSRSILCLPIIKQAKLVGFLYLENNLTPATFTPDRVAVQQLLALQAAISLENARLYSDLQADDRGFRHIFDAVPGFLSTMTPQGQVEFVNQRILDYTGWTLEQMADWRPLLHADEREMVVARWMRSVETGTLYDIEHRILGADGVYRWFLVRGMPVRDADGAIVRWCVLNTDIDEMRKIQEKLQQSEAFLAQGQRISHTGSFGWRVASGEIYWSDETYNIMEMARTERLTFGSIFERVHPDDQAFVRAALDDAIRERTDFDMELRLSMPNGGVKHVHITGRAVDTLDLHYVGAIRDITERMRAEERLRQAQGDLARINRATTMGELTASLAHEVNQPISGTLINAKVCLRMLERDKPDLDEVRTVFKRIVRDTQRAAEVIARIRSQFMRGEQNQEALDVNEIIQETISLLRGEAVRCKVSVRTELHADLPRIVGDRVQLQQVAMNLIVNGFEAMKDADRIREMVIRSQRAESEILVSISDTGMGFPPELAEEIFRPFFTTKPHGTGMGLRICRSIIESHGGRLWAVGAPGVGASFHWSLPTAEDVQRA